MRGIKSLIPAIFEFLANRLAYLNNKRLKIKTLKVYLTGVRSLYINMGYKDLLAF